MFERVRYALRLLVSAVKVFVLRLRGMRIGRRVILGRVRFEMPRRAIDIGDGVVIGDGVCFEGLASLKVGDYVKIHQGVRVSGEGGTAKLEIGHNAWIGEETLVDCKRDVRIGNSVGIGCRSQIWTHGRFPAIADGNPQSFGEVVVHDGAWLPPACLVLPGVSIGEHCIIGTGSVVTKDVPARTFAVGVPCKVRQDDESRFRRTVPRDEKIDIVLLRCVEYLQLRGASVEQDEGRSWRCRLLGRRFSLRYEDEITPGTSDRRACIFTWSHPAHVELPADVSTFVLSDTQYTKRGTFHEWLVVRALLDSCTLRVTPIQGERIDGEVLAHGRAAS